MIATVATTVINNQYAFKQWMIGLQVKANEMLVLFIREGKQNAKLFYSIVFAHCPRSNSVSTAQAVICIWLPTVSDMKVKQSIDRLRIERKQREKGGGGEGARGRGSGWKITFVQHALLI